MAWDFSGSSQHIVATSVPVTGTPLTLAAWINPDNATSAQGLLSVDTNGTGNHRFLLYIVSSAVRAFVRDTGESEASKGTLVAGKWQHVAAVFPSSTSRTPYLEGVAGTTSTTSVTPSGMDRTRIGATAAGTLPFNGRIAWPAVWNADLDDDEFRWLAKGHHPRTIRPDNLVSFLDRDLRDLARPSRIFGYVGAPKRDADPPQLIRPIRRPSLRSPATATRVPYHLLYAGANT